MSSSSFTSAASSGQHLHWVFVQSYSRAPAFRKQAVPGRHLHHRPSFRVSVAMISSQHPHSERAVSPALASQTNSDFVVAWVSLNRTTRPRACSPSDLGRDRPGHRRRRLDAGPDRWPADSAFPLRLHRRHSRLQRGRPRLHTVRRGRDRALPRPGQLHPQRRRQPDQRCAHRRPAHPSVSVRFHRRHADHRRGGPQLHALRRALDRGLPGRVTG